MHATRLLAAVAFPAFLAASTAFAAQSAQTFPDKPIRLIIGSAPGSGPDIMARLIADHLYNKWGQRVVVDTRPGVAGVLSAEQALRANPDGYTWMILTSQLFVATSVYPNLSFNLDKDFDSVSLVGLVPWVLTISPPLPANSVPELIALAKKSPGKLRYGSGGPGSGEHFATVMFTNAAGIDMLHVPYKGVAGALLDTIANEIQMQFAVYPAAWPHVSSGRLRGIGVSTAKRAPGLPNIPTIAETLPGFVNFGWYSVVAPKGSPAAILNKASAEIVRAAREPAFGERLKVLGIEIIGGGRKELDDFRRSERKRVTEIVKISGISITK
ncbi:MAG TPA: tripartite tricarboxylate transporter substrate-binding protein [Burkholderiales bacterium]|nr:tripartite tricarboxylate transporter substrate-binding protein [Burkholderiales bacterium]